MAIAITPAESVEPATNDTGSATLVFAAGLQMVTDGFVVFSAQGAAKANGANSKQIKGVTRKENSVVQRLIGIPTPGVRPGGSAGEHSLRREMPTRSFGLLQSCGLLQLSRN